MLTNKNTGEIVLSTGLNHSTVPNNPTSRKAFLEALLLRIQDEKKGLPEGRLRVRRDITPRYYYVSEETGNKLGRYLRKTEFSLAVALAQKDYLLRLEESARCELSSITLHESNPMSPPRPEDIYRSLNSYRQALVTPLVMGDEDYKTAWLQEPYARKSFSEDDPSFYSARGDRVRSKSEVLIADILDEFGIPYRYEAPLSLKNGYTIHPDFTILRLPSRTVCYLEHCGRMDDEIYVHAFLRRENTYIENGLIPGRDVFYTFESGASPINTKLLRKMLLTLFI